MRKRSISMLPAESQPGRLGSMLQRGVGDLLKDGRRLALCSDLSRFVNDPSSSSFSSQSTQCDLMMTLAPVSFQAELASWLVGLIRSDGMEVEVRYHRLTGCYALYLTGDYVRLLKGAELCHLKKPVKAQFGGGMRDFVFEDAQCYVGVETKGEFLSDMERSMIVKALLEMIRAPPAHGVQLKQEQDGGIVLVNVPPSQAIIVSLIAQGLITQLLPLHNPGRLERLKQRWLVNVFETQPIELIKEYFGTHIAIYFAWLDFMTMALWFPAVTGLFISWLGGFAYSTTTTKMRHDNDTAENGQQELYNTSDICFVVFALFNCVWATTYLEMWKRKQAELSFKWGTFSLSTDPLLQESRPAYKGDSLLPNPVSGRLEPHFPMWKHRLIRYGLAYPITLLCLLMLFSAMLAIFKVQSYADRLLHDSNYFWWLSSVPVIVYALLVQIGDQLYRQLALKLNDLENYRTDDEYEAFLVAKIVLFQCLSAFGSLFYIAFYLQDMTKLRETLATLLITRQLTQNLTEMAVPFLAERLKLSRLLYRMTRSLSDDSLKRHVDHVRNRHLTTQDVASTSPRSPWSSVRLRQSGNQPAQPQHLLQSPVKSPRLPIPEFKPDDQEGDSQLTDAELQTVMSVYARPLDDYMELYIQFGYVLLFSPAFPLAAICALINNLIEVRVDSFKLCSVVQRPFGRMVKDIGAWQRAMEIMGVVGVVVNCALIAQSRVMQRLWPGMSYTSEIIIVVILEHVILATKWLIDCAIPDVPEWIRVETVRNELWRREAFKRESRLLTDEGRQRHRQPHHGNRRSMTPAAGRNELKLLL